MFGMSKQERILERILSGTADKSIPLADIKILLERKGFSCRVKGDHFIFTRTGILDIINLQPMQGLSKPYQVKQVRNILVKYGLNKKD
jgi:hypothetical protein